MRLDENAVHDQLSQLSHTFTTTQMSDLFARDPQRFDRFSIDAPHIFLDYSKNRIDSNVLKLLIQAAHDANLKANIDALVSGQSVNVTEDRPALHTALRSAKAKSILLEGKNILDEVSSTHKQMEDLISAIHSDQYLGYTGKPIRTLVSIGIGGSFLGPKVVTEALKPYTLTGFNCYYVSNIDANDLYDALNQIDPETSLFLIQSKSFSTLETLQNAESALEWLKDKGLSQQDISKHLLAVSANVHAAVEFGVKEENIFPMWDWVGGRYSLWSAIGLPIAFLFGMDRFHELLKGAREMDEHFCTAPFEKNMPVIMALLGVWYCNYLGAQSHAVLPYDHYLHFLPDHLQQLDMESNGKRVDLNGKPLTYQSGPIIWGGAGTNGQHAYHQLLHQGTRLVPADFIIPTKPHHDLNKHHEFMISNCLSQSQALMQGKSFDQAYQELVQKGLSDEQAKILAPHKVIEGNKPSNTLVLEKVTPESLGALIALYEHKVFVQGVMWNINSFDQWGVELGKELGSKLYKALNQPLDEHGALDGSTQGLLSKFKER